MPFKYNLGNFIEALEAGANLLVQAGGGCRYGYYGEIQELILRDLGFNFEFISLMSNKVNPFVLYKNCVKIGSPLSFCEFVHHLMLSIRMVYMIDEIEGYIRERIGFEKTKGGFETLHAGFLEELKRVQSFRQLNCVYGKYYAGIRSIGVDMPENRLKVGVVGELYTLMEPFCNFFLEKELAKNGIQVSRFITLTYLLFKKSRMEKELIKTSGGYLKYTIGADGTDSVARSRALAGEGYDGIIHLKPFGCMPEINAMPIMQRISRDYGIPVLYLSFDSQTSETGVKTRLEAFYDMLMMRKGISP